MPQQLELVSGSNAYRTHLEAPHFEKYRTTSEKMVKLLRPLPITPVMLGAK
jgi:hypothetical protein